MNGEKVNNAGQGVPSGEQMAMRRKTVAEVLADVASGAVGVDAAVAVIEEHIEVARENAYVDGVQGDGRFKAAAMVQLLTGAALEPMFEGQGGEDEIVAAVDRAAVMIETVVKRSR